jgi:predicted ATPase
MHLFGHNGPLLHECEWDFHPNKLLIMCLAYSIQMARCHSQICVNSKNNSVCDLLKVRLICDGQYRIS